MAEFAWEARSANGRVEKGVMEAETMEAVEDRLRSQELDPVKVRKKGKELKMPSIGAPVSQSELVVFVRQFATMIDAGLPLVQCLDILSAQGANQAFNKILKDIKGTVEQGTTFSQALARHPKVFDDLFVNLIEAGEQGGILDTILQRLAQYIEKRVKLKRQVKSAMVYPIGVGCVAVIVLFILLTWVIPAFENMFKDMGAGQLPAITQVVINMSQFTIGNLHWIVLGVIAIVVSISYSYKTEPGKAFWHRAFLKAPVIGPVMRKIATARFTRTLGTLLSSGVPILDAMAIVARASGNVVIEAAINETSDKVREGRTMAEPLMETKAFPSMVVQMIGVGEQTGALDQMLNKIADFYEEEVDVAVAALTSLLEPVMMVVIGGMVGFILIAMYMPIFDLANAISAN